MLEQNCLPCSRKQKKEKIKEQNICGTFLKAGNNQQPIFDCPKIFCEETKLCKLLYPLDDPKYGLHSNFSIPLKDDEETGILLDRTIPFALIDFRDQGRTGDCSDNCQRQGRILNYYREDGKTLAYQLESKNWHSYLWEIDCETQVKKLICKQDRRIPVEALLPYPVCEYNSYNCQAEECDKQAPINKCTEETPCPFNILALVCDDGECRTGWLENPIGVEDTKTIDIHLKPKKGGGIVLSSDVRICPQSLSVLTIKDCGLDLSLCPDSGLQKKDCGLGIKICRLDEYGNKSDEDRVLTLSECGLTFNVKDTDSIDLSKTREGLKADLRYDDTNTVNHEVTKDGLVSYVRYQDRPSTKISENSAGLYVDVKTARGGGLTILEDGLAIKLSNCSGNLAKLNEDGLCVKFYKDDRFFRGDGTISAPLVLLPPSIPVGFTVEDTTIETAAGTTSKTISLGTVEPPFPAPEGYKWVATLSSTLTIESEADPLDIDQVTLAGHALKVNGSTKHIGGPYHAVGNILTIPKHSVRITNTTGGTYDIKQNSKTQIEMVIQTYTESNGTGSFFPTLRCIYPSYSGFLHIVKA